MAGSKTSQKGLDAAIVGPRKSVEEFANALWSSQWGMASLALLYGGSAFVGALAMQHLMGLAPCPLCIFQRVALLSCSAMALLSAAAAWAGSKKAGLGLALAGTALGLAGLGIALRHMHVMWFPQAVSCGPDLEYMMESFPPSKWMPKVFAGEAECAAAAKELVFGLPIPVWSALGFAFQSVALLRSAWLGWKSAARPKEDNGSF